jgi:hypothetical protein
VRLRRRPLRGRRRVPLRGELPLLALPGGDGLGLQGVRRDRARQARRKQGEDRLSVFGEEDLNDTRCAECASLLYSVVREGEWVHVAMGSLVDDPAIRPSEHIYVGSKAPWFEITDDLPQNDEL